MTPDIRPSQSSKFLREILHLFGFFLRIVVKQPKGDVTFVGAAAVKHVIATQHKHMQDKKPLKAIDVAPLRTYRWLVEVAEEARATELLHQAQKAENDDAKKKANSRKAAPTKVSKGADAAQEYADAMCI